MNAMKRLAIVLVLLTIFLSMILPAQAATINSPSLSGIQIFPKDHILNTRIDNLPVDAKSAIYITDLKKDTVPYTGLDYYLGIPYNVVNSTQRHQYITHFDFAYYSNNVAYPIPNNPLFEKGCDDHHMEIIDKDEMVLYELYGAEQLPDGSWSAGLGAVWDLKGYSFRKNNETPMWGTDESGLPVFPGLLRYDEVSAGQINHALRISVPAMQNTWIWPARSAQVNDAPDPAHPPAGQRFRLKASYDISGYPPQTRVILQALKTYGATVSTMAGRGSPVTIITSPDTRWNTADLYTLTGVGLSNLEAVDVSSVMIDKNSSQARQTPSASSSITVTSPNGGESWQRGTTHTVSWSYTGSPGSTVKLVLLKAGAEVGTIIASTSIGSGGTGSYTWPISSSGTTGSDYKVSVQSISQPTVTDSSNNYFALTPATTTPTPTPTPIANEQMKVGIYNGAWKLDINGNGLWDSPSIDKAFQFGTTGDVPVIGDWNGDGKDEIGIFRPSSGIWSLDSDGNYIWEVSDTSLSWGLADDKPVIGDWNGDGKDEIGIFRPSSGIWSLDSDGNYIWEVSDKSLSWGQLYDFPVVGNWNGG